MVLLGSRSAPLISCALGFHYMERVYNWKVLFQYEWKGVTAYIERCSMIQLYEIHYCFYYGDVWMILLFGFHCVLCLGELHFSGHFDCFEHNDWQLFSCAPTKCLNAFYTSSLFYSNKQHHTSITLLPILSHTCTVICDFSHIFSLISSNIGSILDISHLLPSTHIFFRNKEDYW